MANETEIDICEVTKTGKDGNRRDCDYHTGGNVMKAAICERDP